MKMTSYTATIYCLLARCSATPTPISLSRDRFEYLWIFIHELHRYEIFHQHSARCRASSAVGQKSAWVCALRLTLKTFTELWDRGFCASACDYELSAIYDTIRSRLAWKNIDVTFAVKSYVNFSFKKNNKETNALQLYRLMHELVIVCIKWYSGSKRCLGDIWTITGNQSLFGKSKPGR